MSTAFYITVFFLCAAAHILTCVLYVRAARKIQQQQYRHFTDDHDR